MSDSESILYLDSDDSLFESYSFMYQSATALLAAIDDMDGDDQDLFQQSVDPSVGVRNFLETLSRRPSIFKTMTNFTVDEFEEFVTDSSHSQIMTARAA